MRPIFQSESESACLFMRLRPLRLSIMLRLSLLIPVMPGFPVITIRLVRAGFGLRATGLAGLSRERYGSVRDMGAAASTADIGGGSCQFSVVSCQFSVVSLKLMTDD